MVKVEYNEHTDKNISQGLLYTDYDSTILSTTTTIKQGTVSTRRCRQMLCVSRTTIGQHESSKWVFGYQLYLFSRTTMFLCALNSTLLRSLSRRHRNKIPMTFSFFGRSHVYEDACEMNPDNKRDEDHSSRNQPPSICNPHLIPPHQPHSTSRVESRNSPLTNSRFPTSPIRFFFFSSLSLRQTQGISFTHLTVSLLVEQKQAPSSVMDQRS